MSAVRCQRCGGLTNTAVSDWLDAPRGHASRCFVRWVDGVARRGCAYGEANVYERSMADSVLGMEEGGECEHA